MPRRGAASLLWNAARLACAPQLSVVATDRGSRSPRAPGPRPARPTRSPAPLVPVALAVKNGHIKRITDADINSSVLEIAGANVSTTFVTCPAKKKASLGIKLPFLVIIIKNMKKYFTFEVTVLDDKNVQRRFRASNYQTATRVKPFICSMPMRLDDGWNQIQFNLMDFTRRAYGTNYVETVRVQIHANCRLRRVYFADRLYSEAELPSEFHVFVPRDAGAAGAAGPAAAAAEAGPEDAAHPDELEHEGAAHPDDAHFAGEEGDGMGHYEDEGGEAHEDADAKEPEAADAGDEGDEGEA